jgi:hypothetical protein
MAPSANSVAASSTGKRHPKSLVSVKAPPDKKKKLNTSPKPQAKTSKRGQNAEWLTFEERMAQLQDFKDRNGHVYPPVSKLKPDGDLGQWLSSKRSQHKKGDVKPHQLKALRRFGCIGFGKVKK